MVTVFDGGGDVYGDSVNWGVAPVPTADGNVSLQAGSNLGGGTTINWTNCLRTRPWVREEWAQRTGDAGSAPYAG